MRAGGQGTSPRGSEGRGGRGKGPPRQGGRAGWGAQDAWLLIQSQSRCLHAPSWLPGPGTQEATWPVSREEGEVN